MSAVTTARGRFLGRRWLIAIALMIVAGAGIVCWRVYWVPKPATSDPSRTFRDLSAILVEYRENGWDVAIGPRSDGPFRSPPDIEFPPTAVGGKTRFVYRNDLGEIDVAITGDVDRAHLVLPLETADGRLTYMILEKVVPPEDPARKLAEERARER
jgi:hypothetical protein